MSSSTYQTAFVIGSGSWGTALAKLLCEHFDKVIIHCRNEDKVREINELHTNEAYLPGLTLPTNLQATNNLQDACEAQLILSVVPSSAIRATADALSKIGLSTSVPIVSCTKGIERGTGTRMSEILKQALPENPIGAHSGPTHAEELSKELATCAVVACDDESQLPFLQEVFSTNYSRTYTSHDLKGMEFGGAIKNVFALAAGMASGIGLGDNAIAALVTRGLAEMTRLGVALGGQEETFAGLSGLGDLMVTCYSHHSRNNRVGRAIGKGETCEEACTRLGMVAEGVPNTLSIYESAREAGVETPIIDAVYKVIYQDQPVGQLLQELLCREPKAEN